MKTIVRHADALSAMNSGATLWATPRGGWTVHLTETLVGRPGLSTSRQVSLVKEKEVAAETLMNDPTVRVRPTTREGSSSRKASLA